MCDLGPGSVEIRRQSGPESQGQALDIRRLGQPLILGVGLLAGEEEQIVGR